RQGAGCSRRPISRPCGRSDRRAAVTKAVLVTGASKGIGQAIAARVARDGFEVVVHYHRDQTGAETTLEAVRAAGANGRLISFDITDRRLCRDALEADMARHGTYWGVVLNAGIARDT